MFILGDHYPQPEKQKGFTLIELIFAIVVLSVATSGVFSVISYTTANSAEPMIQQQAIIVAQSYMDEIISRPMANGINDLANGLCNNGGLTRAGFTEICHYNDLADVGVRDTANNLVPGLAGYNVNVGVLSTVINGVNGMLVQVTVTHNSLSNMNIQLESSRFAR